MPGLSLLSLRGGKGSKAEKGERRVGVGGRLTPSRAGNREGYCRSAGLCDILCAGLRSIQHLAEGGWALPCSARSALAVHTTYSYIHFFTQGNELWFDEQTSKSLLDHPASPSSTCLWFPH